MLKALYACCCFLRLCDGTLEELIKCWLTILVLFQVLLRTVARRRRDRTHPWFYDVGSWETLISNNGFGNIGYVNTF